jgi:two-component system response regulator FixJ
MEAAGTVHVVDDDPAIRESIAMLLEASGIHARVYDSAAAFLAVAEGLRHGCVLTDVHMPGMDGLTLQQQLAALDCTLPVIVMTGHGEVPMAVRALKAGATDFLEKPFEDEQLLQAVRNALELSRRAQAEAAGSADMAARLAALTPREREVLDRLVAGQANKTIAFDLGTSPRPVEVQRARVMEKMGARSLADLVRMTIGLDRR